jgi:hypothetical protein
MTDILQEEAMRQATGIQLGGIIGVAVGLAVLSGAALAGTITGGLAFPGDSIPILTVIAVEQSSGKQYSVETKAGQRSYRIDVPQGRYIVFAVPHGEGVEDAPGQPPLRGAYSQFSACVMNDPQKAANGECTDHALLTVEITGKDVHKRIDIYDWYLPETEKGKLLAIQVDSKAARR